MANIKQDSFDATILKNNPDARLKTIKEQLPEIISFGQIKIILAFIERGSDKLS